MRLLSWILVNALAVGAAAWLLPGISVDGGTWTEKALTLLVVGVIFGLIGATVKPLLKTVGFCFIVLTLGLLLLVINAAMLLLTSKVADMVGFGLHVSSFATAVIGSIIISIASAVLGAIIPDGQE
ncbi:MAG TPA: phage holin family protein [Marmoricola sp.]|nr:phage holin family protein [Marmoricola sp.]